MMDMAHSIADSTFAALKTWFPSGGWDGVPDMFGKVAIVTGSDSGIGLKTAEQLALHHAHVIMAVRNTDAAKQQVARIQEHSPWAKFTVMYLELSSYKSIRAFAEEFLASKLPLHVLVNNAGVLAPGPGHMTSEDGFEYTLAVNFFGPKYLTHLLLDRLKASAPSRIVNVASLGEMAGDIDWEDLGGSKLSHSGWQAYARSKLFLIMYSFDLNRRLRGTGVDVYAVHPGVVNSPGEGKSDKHYIMALLAYVGAHLNGQTEERGALSTLYAATEPRLQGRGGRYYGPNPFGLQVLGYAGGNTVERTPFNHYAKDPAACTQLYERASLLSRAAAAKSGDREAIQEMSQGNTEGLHTKAQGPTTLGSQGGFAPSAPGLRA